MWLRNMAAPRRRKGKGVVTENGGEGRGEAAVFDLGASLQLPHVGPMRIERGDLRAVCDL